MYPASESYKQSVKGAFPSYLTGTITLNDGTVRELNDSVISVGTTSIEMQAVTNDVLEFGAAVIGQLDISLKTDSNESRYKYFGSEIILNYNVELSNDTEIIPMGVWNVAEVERVKSALKIVAYDNLIKLDVPYTISITGTPFELMGIIAKHCNVELAEDEAYYKSLPNGNETIAVNGGTSCSTYRQAASVIAQMCGAFVQADRFGKISLRRFSSESTFELSPSQRYSSTIADFNCSYVDIEVTGLAGTYTAVSEVIDNGMSFIMSDAPAWDFGVEEVLTARAKSLIEYLDTLQYTPSELLVPSDPSIDCGDRITLVTDNGSVETLITSYTWKYRGQMEIQSVGKNPYLLSNSATHQRIIRDIQKNGTGGGELIYYPFKNIRLFKASATLLPLAQVTFSVTEDTSVVFHATIQIDVVVDDVATTFKVLNPDGSETSYTASGSKSGYANVNIQYVYNSVPLSPVYTHTVTTGSYLMTLFYPITSVEKDSINRFAVYMSTDTGTVQVQSEMFYGTISGQGLAGTPKWDGTLTFEEKLPTVNTNDVVNICSITDSVAYDIKEPIPGSITENVTVISMSDGMSLLDIIAEPIVNQVVLTYTIETVKADGYTFDKEYVEYDNSFALRSEFIYESVEQEIDSGRLTTLQIETSKFAAIDSLEVSET